MSDHPEPLERPCCQSRMPFIGRKAFHEGPSGRHAAHHSLIQIEEFDVYVCQNCGKAEFLR